MIFLFKQLRLLFFAISTEEASFARRGFDVKETLARQCLETDAQTFVRGYTIALEEADRSATLVSRLDEIPEDLRGFAYEGAGMALALLDFFSPWKKLLPTFFNEGGDHHIYMLHVGAGWTLGRLPYSYRRLLAQYDPLLGWLALDGYGFHEGFFAWKRYFLEQVRPRSLSGYALRAFDQGLGRSLWFVKAADVTQVIATLKTFPLERQPDLWSGIGLACTYAGCVTELEMAQLRESAQDFWPHLAQGAAFAAKARQRAGNANVHTHLASTVLCGVSDVAAALVTEECLEGLLRNEEAFEMWRERIRNYFSNYVPPEKSHETLITHPSSLSSSI